MTRVIFILAISLSVAGCLPDSSKLKISLAKPSNSKSTIGSARVTSIKVINDQLVITGSHLSSVTNVKLDDSGANENFSIESKSDNQIIANSVRAISFDISKIFNLILSNAEASATFPIDFSICHSTLNGKAIDCSLDPQPNDVLSYDADTDTWKPRAVNGLNYQGAWSALTALPSAVSAGDYFIVSVANPPYNVGDWIVWNGSQYDRINNAGTVTTVFGRPGAVTANKGDYTLTKMADVDLVTDAPSANQFLKFDGTNWVPGDVAAVVESDPTVKAYAKLSLPTCAAGEVLKSDGTNFSCVTDALGGFTGTANRIVATNASGVLAVTSISDTVLGYLSGVTSNIQTQIDSKLNWAISGLETIHPSRLNLTAPNAGKAVITDGSGFVSVSPTTSTQLGYLSSTTSNVQTQIDNLVTTKADMTNVAQTITALAVTGLGAPSSGSDATNRTYVDTAITNNGVWAKGASSSINYMSGAVGIGTTTPGHSLTVLSPGSTIPSYTTWYNSASPPPIGVYSDSGPAGSMDLFLAGASSNAGIRPVLLGRKSGGTLDAPTALANGDTIMSLLSSGYDGATFRNNASVDFAIGDVVSVGSLPTDILFKTGSVTRVEKMRLNSLGNVGIGTSTPEAKVHIFSAYPTAPTPLGGESSIILESVPNGAGTQGYTGSLWFGSREVSKTEGSAKAAGIVGLMPDDVTTTNAQSDLLFFTTRAGTVTADEKMRLTSAGFLGLGTSAPTTGLHIQADGQYGDDILLDAYSPTQASASSGMFFRRSRGDSTTPLPVEINDTLSAISTSGHTGAAWAGASSIITRAENTWTSTASTINSYMLFTTAAAGSNAERMRITSTGNVGIGTTTPATILEISSTAPSMRITNPNVTIPDFSTAGFSPALSTRTTAQWVNHSNTSGGYQLSGFTRAGASTGIPAAIVGYHGDIAPTTAAIMLSGYKWNGATSRAVLSATEIVTQIANGATPLMTVLGSGNVGIGVAAPTAKLEVAGTTKLGTDGVSFNSMGGCIIASTAISTTATTYTCTGVPASTTVAVNCSGSAAMTNSGTNAVYCRPTGTIDSLTCNTTVANSVAMTWNCMWMKI